MHASPLSIVIPLYNPHPGWEDELDYSIHELKKYFHHREFTLVIVNDGSPKTLEPEITKLVNTYPFIIYHSYTKNRGKGHAIREGIKLTSSNYYIYTDWDFPFGQKVVYETYLLLEKQTCDLVIGKRNETYFHALPAFRKFISKSLQLTNYIITGFKVVDTQAGLKGVSRKAREILLTTKTDGFVFEFEFIRNCLDQKISFCFIDISITGVVRFSNFSWGVISRELKTYFNLLVKK